ncbi:MAG: hypothetical protein ACREHG_05830 [Candidatus Saccharimonadales bacterium]
MKLTKPERTTTVNFDEDSDFAIITTYSKPWLTSLKKNPEAEMVREYPGGGAEYKIPKKLIGKPRMPRTSGGRVWTEEQKQAAADRMRNARAAKGD